PAVMVEVRIDSVKRGTSTDDNGRYRLAGLPPGDYEVMARVMGRTPVRARVHVAAGAEAALDLVLGEERSVGPLPGGRAGEKPTVHADQLGPHYRTDRAKLDEFRPGSLADLVNTSAGVVNSGGEAHVRGGRAGELKVLISDVEAFDVLHGRNAGVALSAVSSAELVAGGVSPEYGNALSGVLEVTTREGGTRFGGDVRWDTDRYGDPS